MMGTSIVAPTGYPHPRIVCKVFDPDQYEGRSVEPSALQPVPDDKPGELFIYLGEPKKTAAVFFNFPEVVARPPRAASKYSMYKTGTWCSGASLTVLVSS